MTATLAPIPFLRFTSTSTGLALIGGQVFTYAAGTTTPQATYTDSTGTVANTNPIILNSRGECACYLDPALTYKIVVKDILGNTISTYDPISGGIANLPFIQAGTGAVSRTAQDKMRERVSIYDFGAKGDGVTDDTNAFNACATYCKANGHKMYMPGGTFLVTRSLNATRANGSDGKPLNIEGDGRTSSIISANLAEAFPILDMSNNKRGSLKGIGITSVGTSLDTCALLLAETTATLGALISVEDCSIASGSPTATASVIGWCADQTKFLRTTVSNTTKYGIRFGSQNPAGVTSKFVTIALNGGDNTYSSFIDCEFLGQGNAAFDFTGGDTLSFTDCYFTVFGTGSASIFDYDSDIYVGSINARGLRFENQSSFSGANCFNVKTLMQSADIEGVFSSDAAAAIFAGPGAIQNISLKANVGTQTVIFNNSGAVTNSTFDYIGGVSSPIGTVAAAASCYNLTFIGRATLAAVQAVFPTQAGINVMPTTGQQFRSGSVAVLAPSASAPTNYRPFSASDCGFMTSTAYTGGSGLQTTASYTFNPAILLSSTTAGVNLARKFAEVDIVGTIAAGVAAGAVIAIQIVQGASSLTLLTASSLIAGTAGLEGLVKFMMVGSTSLVCNAKLRASPQAGGTPYEAMNFSGTTPMAPFTLTGGTISINVQVNSASNNPLANMAMTVKS